MMTIQQAFELALQHHQAGRFVEAETLYRQMLALQPDHPGAWHYLGVLAHQFGRHREAVDLINRSLVLDSANAAAYSNLGAAWQQMGQPEEAMTAFHRALELQPDLPQAHINLSNALRALGQHHEAVAALRRAITLDPGDPIAHYNLGNTLNDLRQCDEAITAFHEALRLKPDYMEAWSNLGSTYKDEGRLDEAVAAYRRALEISPKHAGLHSNLVYVLHFLPGDEAAAILEQRRWCEHFALHRRILPLRQHDHNPERRLRIGYVSPDLWDHVVGRNLWPLFQHHDHRNFEIVCYASLAKPDELTNQFQSRVDLWRSIASLNDEALAAMIRDDGVDILVDLSQHTAGNRLPVSARQPAPVQVSFAGYPESAGLDTIEYRISDRWMDSQIGDLRAESIFLLESFWCYDPCGVQVEIHDLPAKKSGRITFGCLNNFCKVNEPLLRLWARVLHEVPDSRLVMLCGFGSHRQRTAQVFAKEGIASSRIEFLEPRPRKAYLQLYHPLDIVLDTFPYNGHTTSLDALWMGVPVVTLAGARAVSRAGLSQLTNLGLSEWVAFSEDEYVAIAAGLAADLPRLAELRRTLRARMESSVLMDARRFTRNIEGAYRAMWRRWCAANTGA